MFDIKIIQVVPEVVTALRSLDITPEELAAAKKSLVIEHSENKLNSLSNLEALGVQTLFGTAGEDLETLLSMTSLSDVQVCSRYFHIIVCAHIFAKY